MVLLFTICNHQVTTHQCYIAKQDLKRKPNYIHHFFSFCAICTSSHLEDRVASISYNLAVHSILLTLQTSLNTFENTSNQCCDFGKINTSSTLHATCPVFIFPIASALEMTCKGSTWKQTPKPKQGVSLCLISRWNNAFMSVHFRNCTVENLIEQRTSASPQRAAPC